MSTQKLSRNGQLDEKILLQKLVQGDYTAFTRLYETYAAEVTNYAFRFTDDIQIIEDSLHDIFVWLWNHRSHLEITYSIKAYLFKSVRTSIIRKIEKDKKIVSIDASGNDEHAPFYVSEEEKYINNESLFNLKEKMSSVLGLLTSKQKEVIYLRFYQGLSFDEIAVNMNLSTKACYKLMGRAITELRKTCVNSWQGDFLFFLFFLQLMG